MIVNNPPAMNGTKLHISRCPFRGLAPESPAISKVFHFLKNVSQDLTGTQRAGTAFDAAIDVVGIVNRAEK